MKQEISVINLYQKSLEFVEAYFNMQMPLLLLERDPDECWIELVDRMLKWQLESKGWN